MLAEVLKNPIVMQRADPLIYKHIDGYYYFTASVPKFNRIEIRKSKTINGISKAKAISVWEKHVSGPMSHLIWAPEIHYTNGKWYIYFAAAPDDKIVDDTFNHRIFVIENDNEDPMTSNWIEKGQIKTGWESFALDATTFENNGKLYFVWAQQDFDVRGHSNIYIAEMENPWTLKTKPVMLTKPELNWETIGFWVNEGPAVLIRNGRVFLTFSVSATDENYCIGMIMAKEGSNLLEITSWEKLQKPVFKTSDENHQYGPGHNSFTISEDGKQDILVYHSRNHTEIKDDALNDPSRHTRAQVINWREDGTPDFGIPIRDEYFI
ncbi:family 43 glycosylhydrolase [Clostridium estertheticum]|uniref:glycoside hydrolase family 43 protein n=1 Tax=Clostridium estertheticum TaxID=238834 RepID=UPI001C0DA646|nr:family 43 glycosylhydrolase [Clostridium estertheticum]MBU3213541.1 family 43 glycosylhydrolase [Clostridium estertheticum]WAG57853.1 family 43 glycosylhydrolase [Clostridium estertheticum]